MTTPVHACIREKLHPFGAWNSIPAPGRPFCTQYQRDRPQIPHRIESLSPFNPPKLPFAVGKNYIPHPDLSGSVRAGPGHLFCSTFYSHGFSMFQRHWPLLFLPQGLCTCYSFFCISLYLLYWKIRRPWKALRKAFLDLPSLIKGFSPSLVQTLF